MSATVSPEPQNDSPVLNLSSHFLIATPSVSGDLFEKSLVYICQHNADGALGLIVNKTTDIEMQDLFDQVKLPLPRLDLRPLPVLEGGPLFSERGFVLHERIRPIEITPPSVNSAEQGDGEEGVYASSLFISQANLELTTSTDIMHAIANGGGPEQVLMTLGYASWGGGQLEEEIGANAWLVLHTASVADLLFYTDPEARYAKALQLLGMDEWMLSAGAGHA